jgi:hypothetical protein
VTDEAERQCRPKNADTRDTLCVRCSQRVARHQEGIRLCCECYVITGHEPADWHPNCMAAYAAFAQSTR